MKVEYIFSLDSLISCIVDVPLLEDGTPNMEKGDELFYKKAPEIVRDFVSSCPDEDLCISISETNDLN